MKIGIFGNFGWGNLGNSATLEAAIAGVHKFWPEAGVVCICTNPPDVYREYGLDVAPVRWNAGEGVPLPPGRVARTATRLFQRPPGEFRLWRRADDVLKTLDLVIVAGTGVLDDFAIGPMDLPFDLFKWSVQAHRRHVPLVYLSSGAGPIDHKLSLIWIKTALRQARYRSFRDEYSRRYMIGSGFDASLDPVYPDLAFGLPIPPALIAPVPQNGGARSTTVGLGVMSYVGAQSSVMEGESIYLAYRAKIVRFGEQLLAAGYTIRLLMGDMLVDQRALDEVHAALGATARRYGVPERVVYAPIHSVHDLLEQIAATDLVVATRFHNILLALLLEKPVLSISYNQKIEDLMARMGLGDFCQSIDSLDVNRLQVQFAAMQARAGDIRQQVAQRNQEQRQLLEEQYVRVAELLRNAQPRHHH